MPSLRQPPRPGSLGSISLKRKAVSGKRLGPLARRLALCAYPFFPSVFHFQIARHQIADSLANVFVLIEHRIGLVDHGRNHAVFARQLISRRRGRIAFGHRDHARRDVPRPLAPPNPRLRLWREKQVTIKSPRPLKPVKVSGNAPQATPRRRISAIARVTSAALELSPKPSPSPMPAAMAMTFFNAPPSSTPGTSALV